MTMSDHCWKLRYQKIRPCGMKHMAKWKCEATPHSQTIVGVPAQQKCTRLWPEAHVRVKCVKRTDGRRQLVKVKMLKKPTPSWREPLCPVQNVSKQHILRPRVHVEMSRKSACVCRAKHHARSKSYIHRTFKPCVDVQPDVSKIHAAVTRSTTGSQKWEKKCFGALFDSDVVLFSRKDRWIDV